MISIIKAGENDFRLLSRLAKNTCIESHENSAGQDDINSYISEKYNEAVFLEELSDPKKSI